MGIKSCIIVEKEWGNLVMYRFLEFELGISEGQLSYSYHGIYSTLSV